MFDIIAEPYAPTGAHRLNDDDDDDDDKSRVPARARENEYYPFVSHRN